MLYPKRRPPTSCNLTYPQKGGGLFIKGFMFLLRPKSGAVLVLSALTLMACLGVHNSSAQSQPRTVTEKLREIRAQYGTIKRELSTYRTIEREITGFSTEGGTLKAYVDRDHIKSIVAVFYGETGRSSAEYYYDDAGALFFVFQQESRYDKPFGKIVHAREERLYFDRGRLIRWLRNANQQVSPNHPEYQEREKSLLEVSGQLLEAARSADDRSSQPPAPERPQVAEPLRRVIGQIQHQTGVPILLPSVLPPMVQQRIYVSGAATVDGYQITLTSRPQCGANSCFIGSFEAERGGEMTPADESVHAAQDHDKFIRVGHGIEGYYKPLTCGGSCSPPIIEWMSDGVLYRVQFDVQGRSKFMANDIEKYLVAMVNSAIKAGAR
jgi:hypothetical protein